MKPDDPAVEGLRRHFGDVHPLLFLRSVERAKSPGHLFDLLSGLPDPPIVWDGDQKSWATTDDMLLSRNFSSD